MLLAQLYIISMLMEYAQLLVISVEIGIELLEFALNAILDTSFKMGTVL